MLIREKLRFFIHLCCYGPTPEAPGLSCTEHSRHGLTRAEWSGQITSLDLLQSSSQGHYLGHKVTLLVVHQHPKVLLAEVFQQVDSQPVLVHGIICPQVQELAFAFVEFQFFSAHLSKMLRSL